MEGFSVDTRAVVGNYNSYKICRPIFNIDGDLFGRFLDVDLVLVSLGALGLYQVKTHYNEEKKAYSPNKSTHGVDLSPLRKMGKRLRFQSQSGL